MIAHVINEIFNHLGELGETEEPLRYLELGVDYGHTFSEISEKTTSGKEIIKVGVDPYGTYTDGVTRMTSQMYFALNGAFWRNEFDIVYIDACHFAPIVNQEIKESLEILKPNGMVLLDDTVPQIEESQRVLAEDLVAYCEKVSYPVNTSHTEAVPHFTGYPHVQGDVWKSVAEIRMTRPDLSVCSSMPLCTTFVMKGKQDLIKKIPNTEMNWEYYTSNLDVILNPIKTMEQLRNFIETNTELIS